jgi:methylmalonyl-CoA mutase N-terminal domain/subunit
LGGTQSLHTNGFDEALGLPTENAAKLALRTQQVVAYESGVTDTADPLAGSYFVEQLTDQVEEAAWSYIEKIDGMGGSVAAIESGFVQDEIERSAYEYARSIDSGDRIVVGVNKFTEEGQPEAEVFPIDPALQLAQVERVRKVREERDNDAVQAALLDLESAVSGSGNVLVPMKIALSRMATLGEVSDVLRKVMGIYEPVR